MDQTKSVVLFDWSGTLSDDLQPVFLANNLVLKHFGKTELAYDEWIGICCGNAIEFARKKGIDASEEYLQKLFRESFASVVNEFGGSKIYPFTAQVLEELTKMGLILAVISSHPQEILEGEAKQYGVDHFFKKIVGSIPDKADTIKQLQQEFGALPENTFYVGDTINDIRAAKKAGVVSIGVYDGYHPRHLLEAEAPLVLLQNVIPLPSILKSYI
jgi:phosphoglycolate phosphatase